MFYTVGRDKIYRARAEVWGPQCKVGRNNSPIEGYKGGCVFQNVADAHRYIREYCRGEEEVFAVFGLKDVDWEKDTTPSDDGWWRHLLWSRPILILDELPDAPRAAAL